IKDEFLQKYNGEFVRLNDDEALEELEGLLRGIETKEEIVFRANHGSNAYTIKGTFPQDKQKMLDQITWLKEHPEVVRPQGLRGF
ncbi:MAG: radical SAM protein, partial [Nitrosopumilaceae archaeon]